ncbi:MAG: DUF2278 family protein [Planctomycetia bacterium]|nr:DUF2278 family protein [Planctomycetia bacterium]
MPLKNYSLLKGTIINAQEAKASSPHYQILVVDDTTEYRIAVNVRSSLNPPDLEFLLIPDFDHPLTDLLPEVAIGMHRLSDSATKRRDSGLCLDFLRMNLFQRSQMKVIPSFFPGPDNDLNEKIDQYVEYAMGDENNLIYAFGERWGPESNKRDKYFGFLPGNGIHDIHYNQGNSGGFKGDNGVYQDGGLILYFAAENKFVAYFTKFQSQAWNSDEQTGHPLPGNHETPSTGTTGTTGTPVVVASGPRVRIIAALVNPKNVGGGVEKERVTLLNTTAQELDLAGWSLLDKTDQATQLSGKIPAGETVIVSVKPPMVLSNKGGTITLLDQNGLKVHGVAYTKAQANKEGETIVF